MGNSATKVVSNERAIDVVSSKRCVQPAKLSELDSIECRSQGRCPRRTSRSRACLNHGRQEPEKQCPCSPSGRTPGGQEEKATGFEVPPTLPEGIWEQMDHVDLQETFLLRIPMLKSCPHFLWGRFRECFAVTLRERYRAKAVGDTVAEERAWRHLVSTMLFNRPRGWGSIGGDELAIRADNLQVAPIFAGRSEQRVFNPTRHKFQGPDQRVFAPRQGSAELSRVWSSVQGQARVNWSIFGTEDSGNVEGQEKRPQVRVREIPHDISTFTLERLLDFDAEMFSKCLSSARRLH